MMFRSWWNLWSGNWWIIFRALKDLEEKVRNKLRSVLQIDVRVKLVEPKTLERFTGKARRVIDLRNKE